MNLKVGRLYWDTETRTGAFVRFQDGSPDRDVYAGQVMDTVTCCAWVRTRLEKDSSGCWYLAGVYEPGELFPGIPVLVDCI